MKFNLKIPFSHQRYFKFSFIGIISLFLFFLFGNVFVYQNEYFDTFYIISIIVVLWVGCSAISYLIDKKYKWQDRAVKRLVIELPSILIFTLVVYMLFEYVPKKIHHEKIVWEEVKLGAVFTSVISIMMVAIGESSDLLQAWKQSLVKSKELEKENIEAQFHTLKNQVNPHFLFNSLNTLANYVQENQQASEYLQNLSEYLRFTLVLKENKLTTIKEEISIIKKYIFLQKSRFKEGLNLDIKIADEIINKGQIPPFSLQILVENAIKHNMISKIKPLNINILLKDENRLSVVNNLQIREVLDSTKIGLRNITDRYSLLTKEKVIVEKTEKEFKVSIPIIYETE